MSRLLRWLGAALVLAALAGSAGAIWVAGTSAGARWGLGRVLPAGASVDEVEGRLLGPLRLRGVRFAGPGGRLEAEVEAVEVRWSPRRLLSGTLRVDRLHLGGARVTVRRKPEEEPGPPPALAALLRRAGTVLDAGVGEILPIRLEVTTLAVDDLRISGPGAGLPLQVDRLRARGKVGGGAVRVPVLRVDGPGLAVRGSGRLDPSADPNLDAGLRARVQVGDHPPVEGRLRLRGDGERVDLGLSTRSPIVARLDGTARDLADAPAWTLELRLAEFAVRDLLPGSLPGRLGLAASADFALRDDTLRMERLELRHRETGGRLSVAGAAWLREGGPAFRAEGGWADLRWPPRGEPLAASARGSFRLAGRPDSLGFGVRADPVSFRGAAGPWRVAVAGERVDGRVDASLEGRGPVERAGELGVEAAVSVAGDSVALRALRVRQVASPTRLAASGVASLAGREPRFRLRAAWERMRWPLRDGAALESDEGRVAVRGTASRFDFRLDASAAAPGLQGTTVSAVGQRRPGTVELAELRAGVLGGTVTGEARWTTAPDGDEVTASLQARQLDPSAAWPGWPGDLSFRLDADGRADADGPRASLRLADLSGTLRGHPVEGEARLRLAPGTWRLDTLRLRSGEARLDAAGGVERPRGRPEVTASAEASSLSVGGVEAGGVEVDLRWAGGLDGEGGLRAVAGSVSAAGVAVDSLRLEATGAGGRHAARLRLVGADTRLAFRAAGELVGGAWAGSLEELSLESPAVGTWELASPAGVLVSRDSSWIERFCWSRGDASACADAGWSRDAGVRWAARGERLPLAFAGPWLPRGLQLVGEFGLETRGRLPPGGVPAADLRLRVGGGELRLAGEPEVGTVSRSIDSLVVGVHADSAGLRGDVRLRSGTRDSLHAEAALGPPEAAGRRIRGRLAAALSDDGLAAALLDPLEATRGRLVAAARLGGTTGAPVLDGAVEVLDAGAVVVPAGVELRDVALRVAGGGSGELTVSGRAASGGGTITLGGTVTLPGLERRPAAGPGAAEPRVDVRVRGQRFLAQETRAVRLLVSPDLRVAGDAGGIRLTGEVRVPEARVSVRRMEAAVPASPDVRVSGRDGPRSETDGRLGSVRSTPVSVEVDVVLGDRVTVDAHGVRGRLTGRVAVSGRPGRPPTGRGQIELVEGQYTALRRDLPLDHGRLVFAGSPVDDPGLDFRVVRRTAGVEVGLQIGGTARSPTVTLFSSPPMAEADLLSYLLFGRPAAAVNPAEGELLTGAARTLGFVGGDILVSRLGAALSLDDVRLEGEEGGAAVVLGRRLSPRLDLGYAIGLFGAGSVLRLSYRLGRGWVVRAETGAEGAADLLYIIER